MQTGFYGAALTALANAAQLNAYSIPVGQSTSQFTTSTNVANSAVLPLNQPSGMQYIVEVALGVANLVNVFPPAGGNINSLAVNIPFQVSAGQSVSFIASGSSQYNTGYPNKGLIPFSANMTLNASQSGSVLSATQAGAEIVATLPPAAPGLTFKMVLAVAAAGSCTFLSQGAAASMKGQLNSSNGVAAVLVSASGFNFLNALRARMVGGTSVVGDWIEVTCYDGTNWVANGQSGATNGNIFVV